MTPIRTRAALAAVGLAVISPIAIPPSHQAVGKVTPADVRAILSILSDDSMLGRGTGMPGSMKAARYIAEQFRRAGLTPAGDSGYFQHVPMMSRQLDANGTITVGSTVLRPIVDFSIAAGRADTKPIDGAGVIYLGARTDTANMLTAEQVAGKIVIVTGGANGGRRGGRGGGGGRGGNGAPDPLSGAAAIATIEGDTLSGSTVWAAKHPGNAYVVDPAAPPPTNPAPPAATQLSITTHAADVLLGAPVANAKRGDTHGPVRATARILVRPALGGNVIGMIAGTDPQLKNEVVLIDAHYDHLGLGMPAPGSTDSVYNGADDDGSGTTSVILFGRMIKAGPPPKRTLIFMAATGEETGLLGTNWYIAHPVRPLTDMVANLEIEMMDRPDSLAGGPGKAWLTGFERSTMGDILVKAGLAVVPDPRPSQNFYGRSDNIGYARKGIVAHTLSSFDLHSDYHRMNDEIGLADFNHMAMVINGAVAGVEALANGPKPEWKPNGKP